MPKEPARSEERDENAAGSKRLKLTADDTLIFKLISEYRLLRLEHLEALTGRSYKRLHRRIFRLVQSDYLVPLPTVLPGKKIIYRLGKKALRVLVEQGNADLETVEERSRLHELTE